MAGLIFISHCPVSLNRGRLRKAPKRQTCKQRAEHAMSARWRRPDHSSFDHWGGLLFCLPAANSTCAKIPLDHSAKTLQYPLAASVRQSDMSG